ncbi:MAG: hypothetical protein R3C68_06665 [Myxococcota bacterium]
MNTGVLLGALLFATGADAQDDKPGPFVQGRWRFHVLGGGGSFSGNTYFVLGGGVSHFILTGLELGVDVEQWFGNPRIAKLSPQIRYILPLPGVINPYVGGFYRRWFYSGGEDFNTVGGRAGIMYLGGRNVFLGAGIVVEKLLSCDSTFSDCRAIYPEISVSVSF